MKWDRDRDRNAYLRDDGLRMSSEQCKRFFVRVCVTNSVIFRSIGSLALCCSVPDGGSLLCTQQVTTISLYSAIWQTQGHRSLVLQQSVVLVFLFFYS